MELGAKVTAKRDMMEMRNVAKEVMKEAMKEADIILKG